MSEIDIGTTSYPFIAALQKVTTELARRGYDIRASIPTTLLRASVGGQTHNYVTGLTARSPDGLVVWTVRFDWDPAKQSHVNGSWRVHRDAQPRRGEEGEKFFARFRSPNTNGYYNGTRMLQGDARDGDVRWLWRGWKTRHFEVNPLSERREPDVVVPRGTYR